MLFELSFPDTKSAVQSIRCVWYAYASFGELFVIRKQDDRILGLSDESAVKDFVRRRIA